MSWTSNKRRKRPHGVTALALFVSVATVAPAWGEADGRSPLSMRAEIDSRYPGVPWISTATLADWLSRAGATRPVLLDAREPGEYAVSHISGARRVDPDDPDIAALAIPRGATVVVYCSVGYRSAGVAARLRAAGYSNVHNLAGGIFQWANEGRPLSRDGRPASQVHPYDESWGRMLTPRHRAPL